MSLIEKNREPLLLKFGTTKLQARLVKSALYDLGTITLDQYKEMFGNPLPLEAEFQFSICDSDKREWEALLRTRAMNEKPKIIKVHRAERFPPKFQPNHSCVCGKCKQDCLTSLKPSVDTGNAQFICFECAKTEGKS